MAACSDDATSTKKIINKVEQVTAVSAQITAPKDNKPETQPANESGNEIQKIDRQLSDLANQLDRNNLDNAALKQHMQFLLNKVQENQRQLEQQTNK